MDDSNLIFGLTQTIIVLVLAFLLVYKYADFYTKTTHFVCPQCGCIFKLSKVDFAIALKTGVFNERIVTCPSCGYKDRMPIVKD